jgi:hypothetical protein
MAKQVTRFQILAIALGYWWEGAREELRVVAAARQMGRPFVKELGRSSKFFWRTALIWQSRLGTSFQNGRVPTAQTPQRSCEKIDSFTQRRKDRKE